MVKNNKVLAVEILENGNHLLLHWNDNHKSIFHAKWLRFRCKCNDCHPGLISGRWKNTIRKFTDDLKLNSAKLEENGDVSIQFGGDNSRDHVTTYDAEWMRAQCYCEGCLEAKLAERDVIGRFNESRQNNDRTIKEIDWLDYEADKDRWLFNWMHYIFVNGICMVKNAPIQDAELKKMSKLLGDLIVSLYVEDPDSEFACFDYVATKEINTSVENSGHSTEALGLHQDFPYHPPTHASICLHMCTLFDKCIEGGESIIVDVFEAVEILRKETPEHFKAFCEIPCIFEYTEESGRTWWLQRPHITVDYYGKITSVHWSGDHAPQLQVRMDDVDRYYNAYKAFSLILEERKEIQYTFTHTPGKMACFSNMRMIHSRKAFKLNGGYRKLITIGVDGVSMKANYMKLAKKLEISVPLPKIGNVSSI